MVLMLTSCGATRTGCGPEPLSIVNRIPVSVLPVEIRLLMAVFSATVKFPLNEVLGTPVQWYTRSPTRSASPSARTRGGTALATQEEFEFWATDNPAVSI